MKSASALISLFVCRSGPARGEPDLEAAFRTKEEAVDFLARLHGLDATERRTLSREARMKLDRRWHGSASCAIRAVSVAPEEAERLLSGG